MTVFDSYDEIREGFEFDEGFEKPETVKEVLVRARAIIEDEKKWTRGSYVERDYSQPHDPTTQVTCDNVRVCAVGALYVAAFDGPAARAWVFYGDPDHHLNAMAIAYDSYVVEARRLLNAAARDVGDLIDSDVSDIIDLNDGDFGLARLDHLANVQKAFDMAIERADHIERKERENG